jgi:hypothetical protein
MTCLAKSLTSRPTTLLTELTQQLSLFHRQDVPNSQASLSLYTRHAPLKITLTLQKSTYRFGVRLAGSPLVSETTTHLT